MKTLTVGIAGGTASGKTTLANTIFSQLPDESTALLDEDSYYKDLSSLPLADRLKVNFDHPNAFDHVLMLEHIRKLKNGECINKPSYSFVECIRLKESTLIMPVRIIMIEGILVLENEEIRNEMDLKIFVDSDDDIRLARRISRDVQERGRNLESIIDHYFSTVRPMHHSFVLPSKRHADIILPHGGNNQPAINMVVTALRAKLVK